MTWRRVYWPLYARQLNAQYTHWNTPCTLHNCGGPVVSTEVRVFQLSVVFRSLIYSIYAQLDILTISELTVTLLSIQTCWWVSERGTDCFLWEPYGWKATIGSVWEPVIRTANGWIGLSTNKFGLQTIRPICPFSVWITGSQTNPIVCSPSMWFADQSDGLLSKSLVLIPIRSFAVRIVCSRTNPIVCSLNHWFPDWSEFAVRACGYQTYLMVCRPNRWFSDLSARLQSELLVSGPIRSFAVRNVNSQTNLMVCCPSVWFSEETVCSAFGDWSACLQTEQGHCKLWVR